MNAGWLDWLAFDIGIGIPVPHRMVPVLALAFALAFGTGMGTGVVELALTIPTSRLQYSTVIMAMSMAVPEAQVQVAQSKYQSTKGMGFVFCCGRWSSKEQPTVGGAGCTGRFELLWAFRQLGNFVSLNTTVLAQRADHACIIVFRFWFGRGPSGAVRMLLLLVSRCVRACCRFFFSFFLFGLRCLCLAFFLFFVLLLPFAITTQSFFSLSC